MSDKVMQLLIARYIKQEFYQYTCKNLINQINA